VKPIFSNALFQSSMPSRTHRRHWIGTVFSMMKTIGSLGGDSSSVGSCFSSFQRWM